MHDNMVIMGIEDIIQSRLRSQYISMTAFAAIRSGNTYISMALAVLPEGGTSPPNRPTKVKMDNTICITRNIIVIYLYTANFPIFRLVIRLSISLSF